MAAPIRVLLLDNCRIFADALGLALNSQDKISLVAALPDLEEAIALISKLAVNLVLVYASPEEDAIFLIKHIKRRHPEKNVIVLGVANCEANILEYIEAGASGYILKSASLVDVLATMEAVHEGQSQCSPRITAAVFNRVWQLSQAVNKGQTGRADRLSPREKEILEMIALGLVNKEIAFKLGITVCTVKNHVHNLLEKLRVHRRGEAAARLRARDELGAHRRPTPVP